MKILIDKSFENDTSKIKDKKVLYALANGIELIQSAQKLADLTQCKKLKGSSNAYRMRLGAYRIGFLYHRQTVELIRFLNRRDIYHYFP